MAKEDCSNFWKLFILDEALVRIIFVPFRGVIVIIIIIIFAEVKL